MNKYGTFYICLGGGEPFTRKDIFEILDYGKEKQLAISIVTNGLLLDKDVIEKLNEEDLDYLWISFEGLKENHEFLRGKGTFDATINKLSLLKKYYKGKTALRMSINKYNINEKEAKKLHKDIETYGIPNTYISDSDNKYSGGIFVLTSAASKGLEFDAVLINDASESKYSSSSKVDMHLLYVASTRALHELDISYTGEITKPFQKKL